MNGIYPSAKGVCVTQTSDGGFIACGAAIRTTGPVLSPFDAYVVKTAADGLAQWDHIYSNGLRTSVLYCVREVPNDNGFIMCGEIREGAGTNSNNDAYLIKTLPGIPDTAWTRIYNRIGTNDVASSVVPLGSPVGGHEYLLGGRTGIGNIVAGMLMKVNDTGDTLGGGWVRTLGANTVIASVSPTADNDFIACGTGLSGGTSTTADALLCRFDRTGTITWQTYHGSDLFNDAGFSAVQTNDGGFVCTGFGHWVWNGPTTDIYLVKTDRNGALEKNYRDLH
jgi:hypothetical protein